MRSVRILVADDHEVVRKGIVQIIKQDPAFEVVAEARDGREAVALAARCSPDLIIMDVSMPEMNGIDAMRNIRSAAPKMRFVVLSLHYSEELVAEALRLGARGYLLKSEGSTELLACLRAVILNRSFFSASVSEIVLGRFQNSGGAVEQFPPRHRLSPREREIVQPIAEGHSSKEVAARLNISVKTVEAHRAHIMQKLQIQSLSELVRYAVRNRIVEC